MLVATAPGCRLFAVTPVPRQTARELDGEEHVRELGSRVGPRDAVAAPLELQVVERHIGTAVFDARHGDDARRRAPLQEIEQKIREQKRSEMIDRKRLLDTVLCDLSFEVRPAGVVHQDVKPRMGRNDVRRQGADLLLEGEVAEHQRHRVRSRTLLHGGERRLAACAVTPDKHELRAHSRELDTRLEPDARRGPCDKDGLSGKRPFHWSKYRPQALGFGSGRTTAETTAETRATA